MHSTSARDYLGHPCKLTTVYQSVDNLIDISRCEYEKHDPRALPRDIGRALQTLMERLEHATCALEAVRASLSDDSDETAALLTMASEYSAKSENQFSDLAALVLLALERGGLAVLPPQRPPACHP